MTVYFCVGVWRCLSDNKPDKSPRYLFVLTINKSPQFGRLERKNSTLLWKNAIQINEIKKQVLTKQKLYIMAKHLTFIMIKH